MSALRQVLRRGLSAALPRNRFMIRGGPCGIALTFDDGPHPEITPRLLDLLAQHRVCATFFVIGREAERYPALVTRMANEGHLVGHHSWTHTEPAATSAAVLLDEVRRSCALVQQLTGKKPDRFRPPKGQLTAAKILGLLGARQRVILWSQDPKDYQMNDSAPLVQWSTTAQLHGGDIVLLHDVRPHVLAALPALVTRAAICGEPLVTLDAWLPAQRSAA